MSKRKVNLLDDSSSINGSKKIRLEQSKSFLGDSDSEGNDSDGGAKLDGGFKINEDYAKRFEHNKKREERQRLEEKYSKSGDLDTDDSETSSSDEDEDDDGFLATEALDAEISATLNAIRNKDPRVYNKDVTFYAPIEDDEPDAQVKTDKPMYLSDYHRENLLKGNIDEVEDSSAAPRTFAQEQDDLKRTIVKEMHAAGDEASEDEDGGFLIPKSKPKLADKTTHPDRRAKVKQVEVDVTAADKDPETFLSNFMAARAWVPTAGSRFQPFESEDEEEDERAEQYEAAYNLRFEDPQASNEILKTFARDIIAAKSVRREDANSRKKQRDAKREKKEAERQERAEERSQLRRLKIEEMENRLQMIKKAAGIRGKKLKDEDWSTFLDDGWEDDKWESEMNKHFGDSYYAAAEEDSGSEEEGQDKKKKKVKKPVWDDDIDIKDLVPDFVDPEDEEKPTFTLSDSEDASDSGEKSKKSSRDRQQERQAKKKEARLERKRIEDLVDSRLDVDLPTGSKQPARFRYRETSPTSFGLTPLDILMAPDAQLNQFAGLKKMASFRDPEKKRKDKKHLGKKARLRQWRKDTFGNEEGPAIPSAESLEANESGDEGKVGGAEGKKKKKRSRKPKISA